MPQRYENILGTIGNTPIVQISKLAPAGVELFVKLDEISRSTPSFRFMRDKGIRFDERVSLDPYDLLPTWLHPRQ